nr:hypothetical protein [Nonomuraea zeae]
MEIDRAARMPLGLVVPVRSDSLRSRNIDAGYAADVPRPRSTRETTSTHSSGANMPISPATPTIAVPVRYSGRGPKASTRRPMTGCPTVVAR